MTAGEVGQMEAAASLFSAKAGGSQTESAERVAREGLADACEKAQADGKENAQCAVPLRVGLLPIAGRAEGGCPSGSTFEGGQCVQRQVVTQVECPPGSTFVGGRCVANVSTTCAAGLRFEAGRGCVPETVARPSSGGGVAGTHWTFCTGGDTNLDFSADGTVQWGGGNPCNWSQSGSHITINCNNFTIMELTQKDRKLVGEWHRAANPSEGMDVCWRP
jgi:hypothetical protein